MNLILYIAKKIRRVKSSFGSRKTVIYRKKTGIPTEIDFKISDGSSAEHVIYDNSSGLSAEDLTNLRTIVSKEGIKRILRWLDRPNHKLFAIKLDGELAHYGIVAVCKKGDSYGMADKGDLSISPCRTSEKHRRKGLYRANLQYICSNWKPSKWAYGYTRPENIISQKGIEASGFERVGLYKYFRIGRFTLRVRRCGD